MRRAALQTPCADNSHCTGIIIVRMVVDNDERLAVRGLPRDAPLSTTTIDRAFAMPLLNHARDLFFGQFPLSSSGLGMFRPDKPLNPGCPGAIRRLS